MGKLNVDGTEIQVLQVEEDELPQKLRFGLPPRSGQQTRFFQKHHKLADIPRICMDAFRNGRTAQIHRGVDHNKGHDMHRVT